MFVMNQRYGISFVFDLPPTLCVFWQGDLTDTLGATNVWKAIKCTSSIPCIDTFQLGIAENCPSISIILMECISNCYRRIVAVISNIVSWCYEQHGNTNQWIDTIWTSNISLTMKWFLDRCAYWLLYLFYALLIHRIVDFFFDFMAEKTIHIALIKMKTLLIHLGSYSNIRRINIYLGFWYALKKTYELHVIFWHFTTRFDLQVLLYIRPRSLMLFLFLRSLSVHTVMNIAVYIFHVV